MRPSEVLALYDDNVTRAADAIGVTRQTLHGWMRAKMIPVEAQLRIQKVTEEQLQASLPHGFIAVPSVNKRRG